MQEAVLAATGETVASSNRFTDGGFSISYKVTTTQKQNTAYIIQQRFHGKVASMDAFMTFVRENSTPNTIPMPAIYPIPGEAEHQSRTGFGRQITQFVPGIMAERVCPDMSHADKLKLVGEMAVAWQGCWDLSLPSPRQIGELIATEDANDKNRIAITVGPDRHYSLGGPFESVREWLRGRLRHAVGSLQRASGIDEFKEKYKASIESFVENRLDQIPETVEQCPIVALHIDMGLHNVILSADDHTQINAIIDWELCASAPFLAVHTCLEMLFRKGASNGFGAEYPHADQLREAFWGTIPKWKAYWESQGARDFMEWFRFALFMRPEYCSSKKPIEEKWEFWAENKRVVESMLKKYTV